MNWQDPAQYLNAAASGNYTQMENVHLRLNDNFDVDTFFGKSKQILIGNDDGVTAVNVTIDLNGKTWSSTHRMYVCAACSLTILDSSAEQTGVFTSTGKSGYAGRTIINYGTLNLRSGTLTMTKEGVPTISSGGVVYHSKGVFNMYGGAIVDGESTNGGNLYVRTGECNLFGGTISGGTATSGANVYCGADAILNRLDGIIEDEANTVYQA